MVVESLDAEGKVTVFGSGVVIAPGRVTTNRHVIEDGVSGPRQGFFLPWVLDSTGGKPTTNETLSWLPPG